ncbi:hypothetical protein H4F99_11695 [Lysobacter sp. SG-8]|uniref:Uncharacterized protein n=1 Tax=Marilutibacter penaei TaxID=2759900 RepID=A0A7W3YES3_9GAMM|nr:hypothetical protein [Lysobacter penaei]MBB1089144.1 hypothetical protein [Lysobacter penaei]
MTANQIALIQSASDAALVERLFVLAQDGEFNAEEFAVIDNEVYGRFARAYGQSLEDMDPASMMAA